MYNVTNDYKNFVSYDNKQEAIDMAIMFQGVVFIATPFENCVIFSSKD